MKSWVSGVLACAALAGCTTYKLWSESDADEQSGMVQLSYEYRNFENPQVDERAAASLAAERCAGWGYASARREGEASQCVVGTKSDCSKWRVTREYRCVKAK